MHPFTPSLRWQLAIVLAALLAAGLPTPAAAAPPEIEEIDVSFVDPFFEEACGFPVEVRIQGTLIIHNGGEMIEGADYQITYTNLDSGRTVVLRLSGNQRSTVQEIEGLLVIDFSFSGGSRVIVPGTAVVIDVGRVVEHIVLDAETFELISLDVTDVGRSDEFTLELLCLLLSL
jgi:hypothetical protein